MQPQDAPISGPMDGDQHLLVVAAEGDEDECIYNACTHPIISLIHTHTYTWLAS